MIYDTKYYVRMSCMYNYLLFFPTLLFSLHIIMNFCALRK